ncbi:MAG: hypothetical protein ACR2FU_22080 [Streptosporangiaceae bacterium]
MTKGSPGPGSPDSGDRAGDQQEERWPAPLRFGGKSASGARARRPAAAGNGRPVHAGSGYTFLSYMLGGMLLYGFLGWLIGRWTHQAYLLPVGMIAGLALSVALIIYRVTRSGPGT